MVDPKLSFYYIKNYFHIYANYGLKPLYNCSIPFNFAQHAINYQHYSFLNILACHSVNFKEANLPMSCVTVLNVTFMVPTCMNGVSVNYMKLLYHWNLCYCNNKN